MCLLCHQGSGADTYTIQFKDISSFSHIVNGSYTPWKAISYLKCFPDSTLQSTAWVGVPLRTLVAYEEPSTAPWVETEWVSLPCESTTPGWWSKGFHLQKAWTCGVYVYCSLPSNFHVEGFLLVVMWLPKTSTLCFLPGERLMWSAWIRFRNICWQTVYERQKRNLKERKLLSLSKKQFEPSILSEDRPIAHPEDIAGAAFHCFTCQSSCRW